MYTVNDIKSIGARSCFLLLEEISEISEREDYFVVKTPSNPKYVSANFVFFKDSPTIEDATRWPSIFEKEFLENSNIKHIKLEWDGLEQGGGVKEAFFKEGFMLEDYLTMVCNEPVKDPKVNDAIEIREINSDNEWDIVLKDQMLLRPEGLSDEYYSEFCETLIDQYRELVEKRKAKWYGAFQDGELVGSLGLLWSNDIGRFQRIVVSADHQGTGIGRTMIYNVSNIALNELGVKTLVILTETASKAQLMYRAVGFHEKEKLLAYYKYP